VTWKNPTYWPAVLLLTIAKYLNFEARMTNELAEQIALLAVKVGGKRRGGFSEVQLRGKKCREARNLRSRRNTRS
jgi:hypothetical protein